MGGGGHVDPDSLPPPDEIAAEIVESLEPRGRSSPRPATLPKGVSHRSAPIQGPQSSCHGRDDLKSVPNMHYDGILPKSYPDFFRRLQENGVTILLNARCGSPSRIDQARPVQRSGRSAG